MRVAGGACGRSGPRDCPRRVFDLAQQRAFRHARDGMLIDNGDESSASDRRMHGSEQAKVSLFVDDGCVARSGRAVVHRLLLRVSQDA
jgi:hypothetical protein